MSRRLFSVRQELAYRRARRLPLDACITLCSSCCDERVSVGFFHQQKSKAADEIDDGGRDWLRLGLILCSKLEGNSEVCNPFRSGPTHNYQ